LNGHVDVVDVTPLRQWERDPFGAEVEGHRMYGRGAGDMKGGVSAMVYAVRALQKAGVELRGDVILQSVLEEEATGNGSLACLARGFVGDACLIPEPFGQTLMTAEVGVLWMRADVYGSAGHARGASAMVNAIEKAFELIGALRKLEQAWNKERHPAFADHPHPLNFNLGVIKGGNWPSSVPAHCEFTIRMAFNPGMDPEEAKRQILAHLQEIVAADPWLRENPPEFTWYGHHDWGTYEPHPERNPLFQSVARAHAAVAGKPVEYFASTAVTDVRFWTEHWKKPATCYGPQAGQLHGPNEWVDLESVRQTTQVIAATVMDWCGVA
jgi:acetylornithine deacetylase